MASSLASGSILFWAPARHWPRLFNTPVLQAAPARKLSVPPDAARVEPPHQRADSNGAWTAEEQRFLRALRESGL